MSWYVPNIIKEASRILRKNMTNSEKIIWNEIRDKKLWYKFLRQKPIYLYTEDSWLGRYIIPDFCCLDKKIIIEIDWSIHNVKEIYLLDLEKEKLLLSKWFKVIRIKNQEIENNLKSIIKKLVAPCP